MDCLDNFYERFEALEQQTEQLKHHTQALEVHTRTVSSFTKEVLKPLAWILCVAVMLTLNTISYAGMVEVVSSFSSPLPFPQFDLDFDTSTGTLWGIQNDARPNIMNFDLSGNLIQGFIGVGFFNSTGIAVDPVGQRIYYWQNLDRNLQQAHYPDGAFLGTITFPFGYQSAVSFIDYEPVLNRVVMAKREVFSPSQGINIRPGFDFVIPGSSVVDFSVELDIFGVGDLAILYGFELTQDSYWLLGPHSAGACWQIVQIDRTTGQLVDRFILPESHRYGSRGLTLDPSTGLFYSNTLFQEGGLIRVFKLSSAVDTTPPVITVSASPEILSPPNGKLVTVTVSGTITDNTDSCVVRSVSYQVMDEYGQIQPSGNVTVAATVTWETIGKFAEP